MRSLRILMLLAVLAALAVVPEVAAAATPQAGLGNAVHLSSGTQMQTPSQHFGRSSNFTIEMWVRPDSADTGDGTLYWQPWSAWGEMQIWLFRSGGNLTAGIDSFSWHGWVWLSSTANVPVGCWSHVAFVKDGANLRLVLNGQTVATATVPGSWWAWNATGSYSYVGDGLSGAIDDVRVSNAALSNATIDAWCYRGADATHPGWANLLGYWNLDEASGSSAADLRLAGAATLLGSPAHEASTVSLEQTTDLNTALSGRLAHYDADGGSLEVSVVNQAQHGTVAITDPATGAFTCTPAPGHIGTDCFTYQVWDGASYSAPATANIEVGHAWTGGSGATSNWSDAANWATSELPTDGDSLRFAGAARQATTNDLLSRVGTVVFSDPGFSVAGAELTLDTGIVNAISAGETTWDADTILGDDATFTMTSGGTLRLGYLETSGCELTVEGAGGTTILSDAIYDPTLGREGSLVVESGTLRAEADNSTNFVGATTVKDGAFLDLPRNGSTRGSLGGPVTVEAGGTLKGGGRAVGISVAGALAPGNDAGGPDEIADQGTMTWQAGGGYTCQILNATGSPATDWGFINANALSVVSSPAHPFTIRMVTPAAGANGFAPRQSYAWDVLHSATPITAFVNGNVALDTSGFKAAAPGGSFSVELVSNDTIRVRYIQPPTFTVAASVLGGHGTISPAAPQTVWYGDTSTFRLTPDAGYHVAQVRVDGTLVAMTAADEYTLPAVTADHSLSVSFAPPPTTTIRGAHAGWARGPVKLSFAATAAEGSAPVAYTEYRLAGGVWAKGTKVTVRAQGTTTVRYRSADAEGNVETAKSSEVHIDGRPPVVTDLGRPVAWQGGTARCAYRIRDGVAARVSAQLVMTRYGRHVRTYDLGRVPTGRKLLAAVTCSLPVGTYSWRVVATDPAGNRAAGTWRYLAVYPGHNRR